MLSFLQEAAAVLYGAGAPLIFLASGVWISFATGFVQLRRFFPALRTALFAKGGRGTLSPRRALLLSLGAVMGPGNLAGVAAAVAFGGPGAVFWVWLSGIAGMALRYAESALALFYAAPGEKSEGMAAVIRRGLGLPALALFFSLSGVAVSLLMADLTSSGALLFSLNASYGLPTPFGALLLVCLLVPALLGGKSRIASLSPVLVAAVSFLYLALSLSILFRAPEEAAGAVSRILSSAFERRSLWGILASPSFREGIRKGIYSNECGLGSEPAFSQGTSLQDPARQGEVSMLGPFFDTVIFCGITGILCVMAGESDPAKMLPALFGRFFPGFGAPLLTLFLFLLVYTTLISWYYAGESFALSAFGRRAKLPYRAVYLLFPLLVPLFSAGTLYALCDLAVTLMALPSLFAILWLSPRVGRLSRQRLRR